MRVLVSDFLTVNEHKEMNINLIKSLSQILEIVVISFNDYYADVRQELEHLGIKIVDLKVKQQAGKIHTRLYSANLMKATANTYCIYHCDIIVSLTFDTFGFALGYHWLKDKPLAVLHHKNIDELSNQFKKFIFNLYKNRIYHFVFEKFFAEYLINEIRIQPQKIFIIPHPVREFLKGNQEKIIYDCVGLCNSNLETFIDEILKQNTDFKDNNLKILLRSKNKRKSESNVAVINGFLNYEKYCEILNSARTILVMLPDTYIYRLSGSIYDSLSRKKIVLTTSKFYSKSYSEKYPDICFYVNSPKDIISILNRCNSSNSSEVSFDKFIFEHSISNVSKHFLNAFRHIDELEVKKL